MSYQQVTAIVIIAAALALFIYDIAMTCLSGGTATNSWCIYQRSLRYPSVAIAFGLLMGHLFAQMAEGVD